MKMKTTISTSALHPILFTTTGPWVNENQLHIENQKDKCEQIVADIKLVPGRALGRNTTFVCFSFRSVSLFPSLKFLATRIPPAENATAAQTRTIIEEGPMTQRYGG
jgi:hypothetical protein